MHNCDVNYILSSRFVFQTRIRSCLTVNKSNLKRHRYKAILYTAVGQKEVYIAGDNGKRETWETFWPIVCN